MAAAGSKRQNLAAPLDRNRNQRRNANPRKFPMSAATNLSSVSPAGLPPVNLHSRGHRHGAHVESTDDSTSADTPAADAPSGSTQNLFGTLMQSLEQVIGLQPSTTTPAAAAATPATAASATTSASAATPCTAASAAAGTSSTQQQQSTLLQNYLNKLSHKPQVNGSQAPTLAGSSVNASA
jgi:hypothetical protein